MKPTPPTDDLLRSADPGRDHGATIGKTLGTSKPWWRPEQKAPASAPNVVVILLDDLGFSDFGCFGSEIQTPHIDALAAHGLRFTGYTTVPMCTPARAAMMTGKNPHSVGCGWLTHNSPGYPGYQAGEISLDAPTLPELLRDAGYATYAVGKWHNTADYHVNAAASRSAWPLQRGFDHFYGFLGAETHFFSPGQLIEGNDVADIDELPKDYYCTDDWTDRSIQYLRSHRSAAPDKPFLLYLAHNAPHVPLHAKPEDIAAYDGVYAEGWDATRKQRFERQVASGLVPTDWRLSPESPGVKLWADVPDEQKPVMSQYMQIYAAMVQNLDRNIGRLVDELKQLGVFDDTLIVLTSDNGASSIGGLEGAANIFEKRVTRTEDPQLARSLYLDGRLGGADSFPAYPAGWANASNTPFRFYKRTPMNGGIRVPFIASWPNKVPDPGAIRRQWIHVSDLVPTLLDLLGTDYPQAFNGYRTRGLDGVSFKGMLTDPAHPSARERQHFELEGNRGYISGHWKIVSLQPPGAPIALDQWLLFDLHADPTECNDLAAHEPQKLRELIEAFECDAEANYVYPLDNRDNRRVLGLPPFLEEESARVRTFYPGTGTASPIVIAALIADRDYRIDCEFECTDEDTGVLYAIGDNMNGLAAFVLDGRLNVAFTAGTSVQRSVAIALGAGTHRFTLEHRALGARRGEGTLVLDGQRHDLHIDMTPTFLRLGGEGVDVGLDRKRKVSRLYEGRGTFAFTGRIARVWVTPGEQAPDSIANRPEAQAQLD